MSVCVSQIRDIGSGNFGVAKLMRDKQTGELVAVKFIERGDKVGVQGPTCRCVRWHRQSPAHAALSAELTRTVAFTRVAASSFGSALQSSEPVGAALCRRLTRMWSESSSTTGPFFIPISFVSKR